jgi:hypothetical protein
MKHNAFAHSAARDPGIRWARLALRFDAVFLVVVGVLAMMLEVVGHFFGIGPLAHLAGSPYTIGGVEAHGLAAILGAVLWRHAQDADTRPWHLCGAAIHTLLGASNISFWLAFVTFDQIGMGIATTAAHVALVAAHAYHWARQSPPRPA